MTVCRAHSRLQELSKLTLSPETRLNHNVSPPRDVYSTMLTSLLLVLAGSATYQAPTPNAKALAAIKALQTKLQKANSASATIEVSVFGRKDVYEFRFLRPNFVKIVSPESAIYQDGRSCYDYNPADNEYFVKPAPKAGLPAGTAFSLGGLSGLEAMGFSNEPKMVPAAIARKTYAGAPADEIALRSATDPNLKATLWLDAKTGMPVGWKYSLQDYAASGAIKNLVLGPPLKAADFGWKPPKGAKRIG